MRAVLIAAAMVAAAPAAAKDRLEVRDLVEAGRILEWCGRADPVCRSPDGSRYLVPVARGDVAKDGVWIEFVTGAATSLDKAAPRVAARMFTPALGNTPVTLANRIAWLADGRTVAFLWTDGKGVKQVTSLNLDSGAKKQLTRSPTDIEVFALDASGRRVAYVAQGARDLERVAAMRREGYAIDRTDNYNFFDGMIDGWKRQNHLQLFVADTAGGSAREVKSGSVRGAYWPGVLAFNGRGDLVVSLPRDDVGTGWDRYTSFWFSKVGLPQAVADPMSSILSQIYVVDAGTTAARRLWDAPLSPDRSQKVLWAPDGQSVLLGSAFTPAEGADAAALAGDALAEVDVRTGAVTRLPAPPEAAGRMMSPVRWEGDVAEFEASYERTPLRLWFQKADGQWRRLAERPAAFASPTGLRTELRQDLNTPPRLFAMEGAASRLILDVNAGLAERFDLGKVELIDWKAADGLNWQGRLYYPAGYRPGTRYPLVIQTHGYSVDTYSLIGDEDFTSVFAAQVLAGRGVAVVQLDGPVRGQKGAGGGTTPREGPMMIAGMEGMARALGARGVVDAAKVGVTGFSRTGWHVEYALTHGDFPYAAAIAADNVDNSYMQSAFNAWPVEPDRTNGAEAFGPGLANWLSEATGFNADRVRTPIRLQVNSGSGPGWALSHWELYSRLRRLSLPAELYVAPLMGQGTHNLQNPGQRMATVGGAVDWYDFWLNGHEDPDTAKAEQYQRWRRLKAEQAVAVTKPRRPLLEWTATPRP
jgi:hypothetical protein